MKLAISSYKALPLCVVLPHEEIPVTRNKTEIMTMLNLDLTKYPNLDREQLGHIRHFHNLASQLNGDWNHMGSQEPLQEFLDAYRFQIATMAYAAGAAHFHHQPILRSPYKVLFQRLIHKMLNRAVWGYWFNTSLGGTVTDPDLKELRKPWADPVVRENIMYVNTRW